MTIKECADLLEADETTLYRHSKSGRFPTFTVAGMIRVNPAELADQIRRSSNQSAEGGQPEER